MRATRTEVHCVVHASGMEVHYACGGACSAGFAVLSLSGSSVSAGFDRVQIHAVRMAQSLLRLARIHAVRGAKRRADALLHRCETCVELSQGDGLEDRFMGHSSSPSRRRPIIVGVFDAANRGLRQNAPSARLERVERRHPTEFRTYAQRTRDKSHSI